MVILILIFLAGVIFDFDFKSL